MTATATLYMTDRNASSLPAAIEKYGSQLLHFIRSKVNKTEDAEDILQDVWYQLSRLDDVTQLDNVGAWLYAIARNKITDLYRKKKTGLLEDYMYENDEGEIFIKDILLLDDSANPELGFFKELFWKELMNALEELPENQRNVFIWNEIEDMTLQEIANKEQENIKTITSRKVYAVKHLRKRLQYLYDELFY